MKKGIVFALFCMFFLLSLITLYLLYFNRGLNRPSASIYHFLLYGTALLLFLYSIRLNSAPQYAHATMNIEKKEKEKKTNELFSKPRVTFEDVAGLDEAKDELVEVIDFIKQSEKYKKMGAKIPRGILFHGPPGTGKTLLASAVAGETKSAFFSTSGSEFVEKYVGVSAKRIRTLFEKAKKDSPSVIFIDEIDAIGSKRHLESNNEKDQTLDQLLVELDGFDTDHTVLVIGATNRLDLLDEALLRPGRFDRHMYIGNPNTKACEEILKVHTTNKPLHTSVKMKELAQKTHGMSGAHLSNVANEAAIIAVRENSPVITSIHFEQAIERIVVGLKIKNPSVLLKEKKIVSYHEAGHALIGKLLGTDMVQKVSIIPRGQSLGYVIHMPQADRYIITKEELRCKIMVILGGRAAEQLIFKHLSTGAKDDLKKATEIARQMVCEYGMSDMGFLCQEPTMIRSLSRQINDEVNKIVSSCYAVTYSHLKKYSDALEKIALSLMKHETLNANQLDELLKDCDLAKTKLEAV